ncbi:HupE/UreJ family protein [Geminicoccus roseus]|uniref:HupE/UreJ family protein n=1 Tax=Geminicoccus roseus TaxID=404900 RepID=UPI000427781D|nr:HupE/UreJ family protein [Geminicoccus roseus]
MADLGRLALVLLAWLVLAWSGPAGAHPMGPSLLEIVELSPGQAEMRWKTPLTRVPGEELRPVLPGHCAVAQDFGLQVDGGAILQRAEIACREPLEGSLVEVTGIGASKASVVLRVALADGQVLGTVLTPDRPAYVVPAQATALAVAASYLLFGFDHILGGLDHLLFVLGLMLMARSGRQLVATVTAFTLGHSVTLSLAVLGVIGFQPAPIEALIALSIVFLAVELSRDRSQPATLMHRFPWALAFLFGLLHGLGFAGALAEIGLPPEEVPLALFAFNLGIEAGQLLFCGVLLVAYLGARRLLRFADPAWGRTAAAYGIGSMAMFWLIQRVTAIW